MARGRPRRASLTPATRREALAEIAAPPAEILPPEPPEPDPPPRSADAPAPPPSSVRMRYEPRPLQAEIHAALRRFNVLVCHRRFGKTTLSINQLIGSALRVVRDPASARPHFAYIAPLRNQVKNIAWDLLKHYAEPFVAPGSVNEAELRLDLVGGARIQLFGADNVDAARGLGFNGVVLDEYADMDPTMWTQVVSPALADRRGWVIFIGTPRGENHFRTVYEEAKADTSGAWFHRLLKASETGVLPEDELANQRATKSAEEYAQEFECSFAAPVSGAYYGKDMEAVRTASRVAAVPFEPGLSVHTAWDLGIDDATAIWFVQLVNREIRLIDYVENSGVGLDFYVNELRSRRYVYGMHILPHDAAVRELGSGRSRVETLQSLGVGQTIILSAQTVADGINAVRQILPRCWFDEKKCALGVRALTAYRSEYDPKRKVFSPRPVHDWSSHAADAFRYLALGLPRLGDRSPLAMRQAVTPLKYPQLGFV